MKKWSVNNFENRITTYIFHPRMATLVARALFIIASTFFLAIAQILAVNYFSSILVGW